MSRNGRCFVRCFGHCFVNVGMVAVAAAAFVSGCASTGETGQRDAATANVGNYSMAPSGIEKPRVGVPAFSVESEWNRGSVTKDELENMAADQMTTLMFQTNRFTVIERKQLGQLLREQDLEGIVEPGELAAMGKVRGVDYLLLGKVTGFRIRADRTEQDAGVDRGWVSDRFLEGFSGGVSQERVTISTELGVDIRLVDPSTGEVVVANFSDYKRQDTAESMGVDVGGVGAGGDAEIQITEDDAGKVLRLAFDDAIKKMLPKVDQVLRDRHAASADTGGGTAAASGNSSSGASASGGGSDGGESETTTAARFCSQCGTELAPGAKFCPEDGTPVE